MRYLGNKTKLLSWIKECIFETLDSNINTTNKFYDLFSGTGSVSEYFKNDFNIVANDLLLSSYTITKAKLLKEKPENIPEILQELNTKEEEGFILEKYSEGNRLYFSKKNGRKIDGILQHIIKLKNEAKINEETYIYLLYCVLLGINKISNITGVYGAFLKKLSPNATKDLEIKEIDIIESDKIHEVFNIDCIDLLDNINENDIVYIDPPYNARQYGTNYHLLDTIVKYDNPDIKIIRNQESVSGLRNNIEKSKWCVKREVKNEFEKILNCKAKFIFMSYNNEGLMTESEIKDIVEKYGSYKIYKKIYKKYKSNTNNNKKEIIEFLICCIK